MTEKLGEARLLLRDTGSAVTKQNHVLYDFDEWSAINNAVAKLEQRPDIKISDGDVWLVFPNASISIDGLCAGGVRGKITRHNIKKWRDALLTKEQSNVR